ncbi:MAG: GHKL domain-containing protein [Clostridiaceae bacterium]|nr:GHKL domain-containing protein [Clostridiaceae bacterium]
MFSLSEFFSAYGDSLIGHLALAAYLMAVTDERAVCKRLKKLPPLLLSPLLGMLLSTGLYAVPALQMVQYPIFSFSILIMCTFWVQWAWSLGFWRAFASTCMAGVFQVADSTLSMMLFWSLPTEGTFPFAASALLHLAVSIATALLLCKLRFGAWFRLLLDGETAPRQTALLLFALEMVMELLLFLLNSIPSHLLVIYYLLVVSMVVLMTALVIYLAQRLDAARKIQAQQDVIAQQQLYEQDLETIRREVRAFRHDYKNILAGLSHQAGEGELEGLRRTLSEMDAGFDRRLGQKIQASTQIGNLQIPEVRSLLLSKLTAMREKGVAYHLEVLYPVTGVHMDVWDFVRCLGILIDNAVEAALDTEQPWVEIVLLAQDERLFLRVSNPYTNALDPGKMWNEGCSSKGAGRGMGLSSYQHILMNYSNASPYTSWAHGVFVQELTLEDKA